MTAFNRNLIWLITAVAVVAIAYFFADILMYILVAWVLSMLGKPFMNFYQSKIRIRNWHLNSTGAAILTIFSFFFIILGVLLLFVPTIVEQARNLAGVDYQALGEKLREPFAHMDQSLHDYGLLSGDETLAQRIQSFLSTVFRPTMLGDFAEAFISTAGSTVVAVASITFILFFFLKDNTLFVDMLHAIVPNRLEEKVMHAVDDSSKMLGKYFGGLITQMAAFTTIISLLLWILGINNALLIGAFGGLFNIIPYVGPIFGMLFGVLITTSSHLDLEFALLAPMLIKVLAAFGVTQFIDNNFLGPAIFSKSLKAHPLEIFLVTLIAAKVGGVVGMVLGIPIYTVLRVIARVFFSEFKLVQALTSDQEEE
ncbi:MAG: AI-2E family transporter [Saprospiraceae bacterium]|jgi:predicted PurR-regulated permease PerM